MKRLLLASAAVALSAGYASAQTTPEGLVTVNIQDVLQDIAVDLNISDANIPVTIQLPVSVAANVCDVSVNALSLQVSTGTAQCTAVTGSQELTQIVQQEMETGGTGSVSAPAPDQDAADGDSADADAADGTGAGGDAADRADDATAGDAAQDGDAPTESVTTGDDAATTTTAGDDEAGNAADDATAEGDAEGDAADEAAGTTGESGGAAAAPGASGYAPGRQEGPARDVAPGRNDQTPPPGQTLRQQRQQ
jgi:hypothetical protein